MHPICFEFGEATPLRGRIQEETRSPLASTGGQAESERSTGYPQERPLSLAT